MAEFPALPLWTDAYLGDTTHLTTTEHGAYLLLLMTAWRTKGCQLPDDDRLLARFARCSIGQWRRLRPTLQPFFVVENGHWRQGRLTDEAVAVRQKREKAAQAGRASALKRQGRHSTDVDAKLQPNGNGASTQEQHYHNHNQEEVPLDKESNGAKADSDAAFWASAKAYLGKSKASLIGQWVSKYGREATAQAITAAQLERAIEPVSFIQGRFRLLARAQAPPEVGMPC